MTGWLDTHTQKKEMRLSCHTTQNTNTQNGQTHKTVKLKENTAVTVIWGVGKTLLDMTPKTHTTEQKNTKNGFHQN
jgi:hypothetical protein